MKLKENNPSLDDLIAKLQSPNATSFWIDSSGGPDKLCNKSFIGISPKYYLHGSLNEVTVEDCDTGAISYIPGNCFDILEEKLQEEKHNKNGIFVGYISYDLVNPQSSILNPSYPDFFFAFYENCSEISSPHPSILNPHLSILNPHPSILSSNMTDEEYLRKVKEIKEEIKKGNVYQANLTREYLLETTDNRQRTTELDLYLKLRSVSPNPYGCFFKTPFVTMLSSSPEEFLYVGQQTRDNKEPIDSTQSSTLSSQSYIIRTRPVKGTLPKNEQNIDPKNQAENLMIVDLERNDLGRICKTGTVKVSELLNVEQYEHLNHVVSSVEGELKENIKLKEIFEATFPGGSITGAPKIAAMEIINRLEPTKRGAYTGSFGYIKTDGTMNFNILIRTIFITKDSILNPQSSILTFNVGGGIVADSSPEAELEEIRLKALGIMDALEIPYNEVGGMG